MKDEAQQPAPCRAAASRGWRGASRGGMLLPIAAACWAVAVAGGMYALWHYAHSPGAIESSPPLWPAASRIPHPQDRPVLLLFAHTRCPCTRASIRELERITARAGRLVATHVVFLNAPEAGSAPGGTDLRGLAESLPGVQCREDRGGFESSLFRAQTSGLTLLYSPAGELLFQGGITPSRAHEGENVGISALEAALFRGAAELRKAPVFGCPLHTPDHLRQTL